VRLSDGKLIKGFTQDFFPIKERFHLIPADNPSGGAGSIDERPESSFHGSVLQIENGLVK
jgi:hypothetical protein